MLDIRREMFPDAPITEDPQIEESYWLRTLWGIRTACVGADADTLAALTDRWGPAAEEHRGAAWRVASRKRVGGGSVRPVATPAEPPELVAYRAAV